MCLLSDDVIDFFARNKNSLPPRTPTPRPGPRPFKTPPHAFLNIGMFFDLARYEWSQPFKHFQLIWCSDGSFYAINISINITKTRCLIGPIIPLLVLHFLAVFYLETMLCSISPSFSSKLKPWDFSMKDAIFKTIPIQWTYSRCSTKSKTHFPKVQPDIAEIFGKPSS